MKKIKIQVGSIVFILLFILQLGFGQNNWQINCGPIAPDTTSNVPLSAIVNGDSVIIIPIVFHILTQGGPENISKSHVLKTLEILNQDFNRQNPDTFDIPGPFHPVRGNPKIEFRLARIDPEGNCTDGIERIYTPQTGAINNFFQMQPNFSWDHTRYMNIYVVNWIDYENWPLDFAASYLAPVSGPNIPAIYDALLMCYFGFADGFNGVPPGARGHTLSHEMGHNLGLKHIWGNAEFCSDDDDVGDTPLQNDLNRGCPSFPHVTCSNGPSGDMFNNFMDYAECQNMFTQGQADRMRTCLENNEWRKSLWTPSNLAATGIESPSSICENPPIADFGYGNYAQWLCAGKPVQFYEASTWSPDSYHWKFNGGIPETSTDIFPSVVFSESGMHNVELIVSNSFGIDTVVKTIQIQPAEVYYDTAMTESFEDPSYNDQIPQWSLGGKKWSVTNLAAYSGTHSIRLDSSLNYFSTFFTHIYDLNKVHGTGRTLEFKVALGMSSAGSIEGGLRVTWKRPCAYERYEILGNPEKGAQCGVLNAGDGIFPITLQTAVTNQPFIPNSTQWKTITLPIPDSLTGEIQIGFDWGNFTSTNKLKGLYIDDIKVISLPVSVEEISTASDWTLFPNPASRQLTIEFANVNRKMEVTISDITGKIVYTNTTPGTQNIEVNTGDFAEGVYIVQIQSPKGIGAQKFIIAR